MADLDWTNAVPVETDFRDARDRQLGAEAPKQLDWASAVPAEVEPEKPAGLIGGIASSISHGLGSAVRAGSATLNNVTGDLSDVERLREENMAAQDKRTLEAKQFSGQYDAANAKDAADGDSSLLNTIGNGLRAVWDNPTGFVHASAEQTANMVAPMVGMAAGSAGGAAIGGAIGSAVAPGPGTAAGILIGTHLGRWLGASAGTSMLEIGGKAMEKAEGGLTAEEASAATGEGAIKSGVIGLVDTATLGLGGKLMSKISSEATQAGALAEAKVLMSQGVDVTKPDQILRALSNTELRGAAKAAGDAAAKASLTAGQKAAMAGTGLGLETLSEGVGEYAGEFAATGKGDMAGAVMESLMGGGQSMIETAYNYNQTRSNELNMKGLLAAGSAPEAVAYFNELVAAKAAPTAEATDALNAATDEFKASKQSAIQALPNMAGPALVTFPDGSTMTGAEAEQYRLDQMTQPADVESVPLTNTSQTDQEALLASDAAQDELVPTQAQDERTMPTARDVNAPNQTPVDEAGNRAMLNQVRAEVTAGRPNSPIVAVARQKIGDEAVDQQIQRVTASFSMDKQEMAAADRAATPPISLTPNPTGTHTVGVQTAEQGVAITQALEAAQVPLTKTAGGEIKVGRKADMGVVNTIVQRVNTQFRERSMVTQDDILSLEQQQGATSATQATEAPVQGLQGQAQSNQPVPAEQNINTFPLLSPNNKVVTRTKAKALQAIGRLTGTTIKFFHDKAGSEGFYRKADEPNVVYINTAMGAPSLRKVFGHEVTHQLRNKHAEAWDSIETVVRATMKPDAMESMFRDYFGGRDKQGVRTYQKLWADYETAKAKKELPAFFKEVAGDRYRGRAESIESILMDEMISDLGGNRFGEEAFWEQVFGEIIAKEGTEKGKGIIQRLMDSVIKMIKAFNAMVKGDQNFSADELVDVDQVRTAMAKAYATMIEANRGNDVGGELDASFGDETITQEVALGGGDAKMSEGGRKSTKKSAEERKGRTLDEVRARIGADYKLTISPDPKVLLNGESFETLDADARGPGLLIENADAEMRRMLDESIAESLLPAELATDLRPPSAAYADKAFKLTDGSRFWYELSSGGFNGGYFNLIPKLAEHLIDIVAGTSGGQKPTDNLKVAVAAMAQDMQGKPVTVGTRDPSSLTGAMSPKELTTHKFGNFSDTMQLLAGLRPGVEPLPTIDLQMAAVFGVKHAEIASNPVMYETICRFLIKLRDAQNVAQPTGAQPYESWQMQALLWVAERNTSDPDSYNIGMPKIVKILQDAGIPTPGGMITQETLMDPRTSEVLSPTSKSVPETPTMTFETRTMLTDAGRSSTDAFNKVKVIDAPWAKKLAKEFESIQRRTMKALGQRQKPKPGNTTKQPSVLSQLAAVVMGHSPGSHEVSRVDTDGWGTFDGDASPNMRVPLSLAKIGGTMEGGGTIRYEMADAQRKQFMSVLGEDFKQAAMADSQFVSAPLGQHDTFSILIKRYDKVDITEAEMAEISSGLGRPLNYSQVPNGWLLDINVGGFNDTPALIAENKELARVQAVMQKFASVGALSYDVLPRKYDSDYLTEDGYPGEPGYNEHIKELENGIRESANTGGSRGAGRAAQRQGDLARLREQIQGVYKQQESAFKQWEQDARELAAKRGVKLSERRSDAGSSGFAGAGARADGQKQGVSATGIHYSKQERKSLAASMFGTGLQGAELERVKNAADERLRHRIYFYTNTGKGINPEFGVGPHAHKAELNNLYDIDNDPLDLGAGTSDANLKESRILDAGFDGFISQAFGAAVLIGPRNVDVEYLGTGVKPDVDRAGQAEASQYQKDLKAVAANALLPSGENTGARWKELMAKRMPEIDVSHLDDATKYYKSGIVKKPAVQFSEARDLDFTSPEISSLTEFWKKIAGAEDAFQHKTTDSKPMLDVFLKLLPDMGGQEVTRMYELPRGQRIYRLGVPGQDKDGTNGYADAYVTMDPSTQKVWIDVSQVGEGNYGSRIYNAVANWAHNNHYVFVGDPADISVAGSKRRLENMISSALKFGTLRHLAGNPKMNNFIEQETGKPFDDKNLESLIKASYDMVALDLPQIKGIEFNFDNGNFEAKKDGRRIKDEDFIKLANHAHRNPDPVRAEGAPGYRTLKRAVLTSSFLSRRSDGRGVAAERLDRLLEPVSGSVSGRPDESQLPSRPLSKLLYSERRQPWYYSKLEESIKGAKLATQPAIQWAAWLKGQGLKQDELQWSGVMDYLAMRGKERITKDELAQWVAENNVKLDEDLQGEIPAITEDDIYDGAKFGKFVVYEDDGSWSIQTQRNGKIREVSAHDSEREAADAINRYTEDNQPTKFAQYVLPGGENYKELLITLPPKQAPKPVADNRRKFDNSGLYVQMEEYLIDELQRLRRERGDGFATQSEFESIMSDPWAYADMVDFEPKFGIGLRDVVIDHGARKVRTSNLEYGDETAHIEAVRKENEAVAKFMSSHFDQPNILAHIRMNERTDAQGRKVLFLEEIQSDWGQKGKKEGFASNTSDELAAEEARLIKEKEELLVPYGTFGDLLHAVAAKDATAIKVRDRRRDIEQRLKVIAGLRGEIRGTNQGQSVLPPSAPFVADTKSWTSLALKRAIAYAVDNGFDRIAWTTGEQQAARYSLSKVVDQLGWTERGGGGRYIAMSLNGTNPVQLLVSSEGKVVSAKGGLSDAEGKQLDDVVGKAVAEKIMAEPSGDLDGERLNIGGEGMKGYYDAIVPQVAKKLGAEVGVVDFGSDEMTEDEWLSGMEARATGGSTADKPTKQPGFTITDAMRKQMPLFSPQRSALTGQPINASWSNTLDNTAWTDFVRKMQDKLVDTKGILAEIRKAGVAIKDAFDPYLQEMLYHGRAAKRVADFAESELKPLLAEMHLKGVEMQELEDYLWARHAGERNAQMAKQGGMADGGSGLTNAEAAAILSGQSVTKNGRAIQIRTNKMAAYQTLAAKVKAINDGTLQALVDAGLETQQTVNTWKATYGDYVPLKRDMESDDNYAGAFNLGSGTGQGFSVKGSASKRALGSERGVVDILANVAMQRERAIVRAEKNRVSMAVYGLALTAPNPEFWIPINPQASDPAYQQKLIQELVAMGVNPIDAQNIAKEPKQRYIDPRTGLEAERINPSLRGREDVLAVRINGQDRFIMFSSDPVAQNMVRNLKNLDNDQLGAALSNVGKVTRWFASINTQYNPIFGLTNFIRDSGAAYLNLSSTALKGKQGEVRKNVLSALRGVYIDLREHRAGKAPTSQWAQLYEEFQREGGQTGYMDAFRTSADRAEGLLNEFKKAAKGEAAWKVFSEDHPIGGWLSDYNSAIENAWRLAAYKAAKDNGMSKEQAASLAKNLTVNFNKRGNATVQLGALYAFFNAAVQGTARIAETMVKDGKLTSAGQKIVYGGLLAGSMQAVMFAAAGWDDDEPPQYLREKNFIIPLPNGKYVAIPYPLGYHVIPNLGRVTTEFVLGGFKDPAKRLLQLGGSVIDGFNPLGSSSLSQTIAPTVADPIIALAENKDFTGKNIYKEDFNAMKPTAGWTRTKDTASDLAKGLSYGINYVTGGGKYQIGASSPTPDQIDYLIGQATGGLGREINKAYQAGKSVVSGEELPAYKVPVAGRFYGSTTGQASETSKFYSSLKRIGAHASAIKEMEEAKDGDAKMEYLRDNPDAKLVAKADKASRELGYLKRQKREAMEKGDKEKVQRLEQQITTKVKLWNQQLEEK